jgi:hypothetical protein
MRLLLVHGRSQGGLDPNKLSDDWQAALRTGLIASGRTLPAGVKVDFPFYGDVLDDFARQFDLTEDEVATKKGVGAADEFAEFARQIALQAQDRQHISDAEVRADIVARHGPDAVSKGPENWEWVQSIISILDRLSPQATEKTFSLFLRDVFLYTRRNIVKKAINKIVADKLTDDPTVVVAHSLGTVVIYNVLAAANKPTVSGLVTLGSPLGIRGISGSLDTPLRNIAGPKGWFNAYDERDVVALNPLDASTFKVDPAIVNDNSLKNETSNHHGISSYLDKAVVAQHIASYFE